ncbi:MAG: hypothetical protein E7474_06585 [Ruminococcaceae bacterium]|nr:hypothetical protein [Oscillospiraceae bacterium]
MTEEDYRKLICREFDQDEQTVLIILIATLISSDTILSADDCRKSLTELQKLKSALGSLTFEAEKQEELKLQYMERIDVGLKICERDLKNYLEDAAR